MQRKYLLPAVLAALPVLLSPDLGSGRASDGKLSLLWRPASTQPVVRLRGSAFPILAVAPASAKGWEAKLVPPYSSWKLIKLQLSTPAYDKKSKRWKISATIPLTTPEELYGLQLSHSGGSDTNKISVRVLKTFPKSYYVAHYTDTQNATPLAGHTSKMKVIINELNLIQPELSINTGDLVTYGNVWPQGNNEYKNFIAALEKARITSFHIPGNHDIYHLRCWDRAKNQAQYEGYIGERNYSFGFGKEHFTGVEVSGYTWLCPHAKLTTAQVTWVKADLTAAVKAGRKPLALFGHQLEYNVKLASSNLHKLCNANKVPLYLYGHIHSDKVDKAGKLPTHYVATDNAGASRYRLLDVSGGKVLSYGYAGTPKSSIPTGKVSVSFSQPNNGKSSDLTATYKNGLSQALKYVKATFIMAPTPAKGAYKATGGTLYQVVDTAKGPTYVYVRGIKIKAKGQAKVRVFLSATPDAGVPDGGTPDASAPDVGTPDAGLPDASTPDASTPDAGTPDAATPDAVSTDGPTPDATADKPTTTPDTGGKDNGVLDSAAAETGAVDAGPSADSSEPPVTTEGCSCDATAGGSLGGAGLLLLALACRAGRRRRAC